jgi:hypothetical protein
MGEKMTNYRKAYADVLEGHVGILIVAIRN